MTPYRLFFAILFFGLLLFEGIEAEEPPTLRVQGRVIEPLKIAVIPFLSSSPYSTQEVTRFFRRLEQDLLYHGALTTLSMTPPETVTFGTQDLRFFKALGADLLLLYQIGRSESGIGLRFRLADTISEREILSQTFTESPLPDPEIVADKLASRVIGELLKITPPFGKTIFFQVREPSKPWRILGVTDFLGSYYRAYFPEQRLILSPFPFNSGGGVFIGNAGSFPQLFLFHLYPSPTLHSLYRSQGNLFQVTYRPKSSPYEFVFSEERAGNVDLYLLQGSAPLRLTTHPQADYSPAFSPDGKKLAFISERSGFPSLWVKDLESGVETPLYLGEGGMVSAPDWSPDGQWLTFVEARGNRFLLMVYSYPTRTPSILLENNLPLEHPSFAVDSRTILFSTLDGSHYALYRIDRLIPVPKRLIALPGDARMPVWER